MNYEKKYKEALKRAKDALNDGTISSNTIAYLQDIFPELKESEDEKIRKAISQCIEDMRGQFEKLYSVHHKDAISWLEKQGEHADFLSKIQVGDKVTRNEGGVLVNISQLERVAKPRRVKPAKWSEEDEIIVLSIEQVMNCAFLLNIAPERMSKIRTWLKSLKQRIGG